MTTLETTHLMHVPISRQDAGFDPQKDRGNAILLDGRDCQKPEMLAAYQAAGLVHEGVRITSCDESLFSLLEQMQLTWCPWPDQGFTLAVLEHAQMSIIADRLVMQRHMDAEQNNPCSA